VVQLDNLDSLARLALMDSRVLWDLRDQQARWVKLDLWDRSVYLEQLVIRDLLELLVHLDQLESLEMEAYVELMVPLAVQGLLDLRAKLVLPEQLAYRVKPV
jgi:hypothetical protein